MKFIVLAAFIACATAAVIITDAQREFAKVRREERRGEGAKRSESQMVLKFDV